jgi:hypothetical protein
MSLSAHKPLGLAKERKRPKIITTEEPDDDHSFKVSSLLRVTPKDLGEEYVKEMKGCLFF